MCLSAAGYAQHGMGLEALNLHRRMRQEGLSPPDSVTYVCLLQACASVGAGALHEGKQLHAQINKQGLNEDMVFGCSLVNMYAKCGSLEDACTVFNKLANKEVVTWTAMIAGYVQQGMGEEAIRLYGEMQKEGVIPNTVTYVCLLQACARVGEGAFDLVKELHAQIEERDLDKDVVLGAGLVDIYVKYGWLGEARKVFDKLLNRDVVTWTTMIAGYAQQGMGKEALDVYKQMQQDCPWPPNPVTYLCLLQACASLGAEALDRGKQLHAEMKKQGLQEDGILGVSLVNMYAKCCSLVDAHAMFVKLAERDVVAWTAMIAGYAQQGMGEEALSLYKIMQQEGRTTPNAVTFVCLLQACANVGVKALVEGKRLHAQIKERGLQEEGVVGVSLVNMYVKCCGLEDARSLFEELADRNIVAWNTMIAGYAQQGMGEEALSLYSDMQQEGLAPDCFTYVSLLQACANIRVGALSEGKLLHARIKETGLQEDGLLGVSLVNMYAKCCSLQDACSVFEMLPERNLVAWNAMIAGYAKQGMGQEALGLYARMQQEGQTCDSVTYVSLLQACAVVGSGALDEGKDLHAQIRGLGLAEDVVLGGSLVNMYSKCGNLEDARSTFEKLVKRNLVAWNAMIAGYAQQGMGEDALNLYSRMQEEGPTPDSVTYVCLLQACADVAALSLGQQLHVEIEERGLEATGMVGAALVNMYAKCGSMNDSQRVFDSLSERGVEVWGALLGGYAGQGDSQAVFKLLDRMILEGVQPDEITFLSVLAVCSHVGAVEKGRKYFQIMRTDYGISASMEHYTCMVDLLSRAGHMEEALQMTKCMPFPPTGTVWRTLLSACRKWKNVEIGQQAFQGAISVDENDPASYVLMANVYASAQMWEAAKHTQARRIDVGAWKKPGQSWWTDTGGAVHTFVVGNKTLSQSDGILGRLEQLQLLENEE